MGWVRWVCAVAVALSAYAIGTSDKLTLLFSFPLAGTLHRAFTGTPVPFSAEAMVKIDLAGVRHLHFKHFYSIIPFISAYNFSETEH